MRMAPVRPGCPGDGSRLPLWIAKWCHQREAELRGFGSFPRRVKWKRKMKPPSQSVQQPPSTVQHLQPWGCLASCKVSCTSQSGSERGGTVGWEGSDIVAAPGSGRAESGRRQGPQSGQGSPVANSVPVQAPSFQGISSSPAHLCARHDHKSSVPLTGISSQDGCHGSQEHSSTLRPELLRLPESMPSPWHGSGLECAQLSKEGIALQTLSLPRRLIRCKNSKLVWKKKKAFRLDSVAAPVRSHVSIALLLSSHAPCRLVVAQLVKRKHISLPVWLRQSAHVPCCSHSCNTKIQCKQCHVLRQLRLQGSGAETLLSYLACAAFFCVGNVVRKWDCIRSPEIWSQLQISQLQAHISEHCWSPAPSPL
ncbi:uncharacterized protein LOC112993699 [Dromaius novaehollandiae]|uniref:uncharacterized protein LOC112993699 n=1 Tax=Dromaius novaehollandiae TaxID=8790 RepID=UPI00311DEA88